MSSPGLAFVVPDPTGSPSGGHTYNTRILAAWRGAGRHVAVEMVPGRWPRPDDEARAQVAAVLSRYDTCLVDGLIGSCCPEEIAAARQNGRRVVLLVHLPLADETGLSPTEARDLEGLERWACHVSSCVVSTSHTAAADLRRRHALADVVAVPPGADVAPLAVGSAPTDPARILMVGAVTRRKNQLGLVTALGAVADRDWTAELIGPCPDEEYLSLVQREIDRHGLNSRILFRGPLDRDALEYRWRYTDLLVLPSLHETFGLVVTEALARGIPTLVSSCTGAVEALTGVRADQFDTADRESLPGGLVDPHDTSELAAALARWLDDPAVQQAWRARAVAEREVPRPWSVTADALWSAATGDAR